jgi:ABC-type multidrug transport system fused ATPase/permease subunit
MSAGQTSSLKILVPLVRKYLVPYWGQLLIAMVFMLISAAATAAFAKLLQPILDKAMIGVQQNPETVDVILPLGAMIFLSFAVRGISTYLPYDQDEQGFSVCCCRYSTGCVLTFHDA